MDALFAGYALGLAVAAGFGPISALCLSSGLRYGFWPAWGVGLGAAAVDGLYSLLAGLGAAALLTGGASAWLQIVGGVALIAIGLRTGRARGAHAGRPAAPDAGATFRLSFVATLANPLTIVSWAAVFAGVVPRLDLSRAQTVGVLPAGVAAGTLTWFTIVAAASAFAGRYVGERTLRIVSVAAGVVIAGFGLWFVVDGIRALVLV